MRSRFILFLFLIHLSLAGFSQKSVTLCGEYVYHAPENISLEQAKKTALERAKLEALAEKFGTVVSQTNTTTVKNNNEKSDISFSSFGGTEVKGEWLENNEDPKYNIAYEQGMLVVTAHVCGKAREIKKSDVDLMTQILCNGMESERFKSNDRVSVKFKSPIKGFLAIFLLDDNNELAECLLPYENEEGKAREIKNSTEYIFLSTKDPVYPYREESILHTKKEIEFYRVTFIFSTAPFVMPLTTAGEYVHELSIDEFQKWIQKNRIKDENMQRIEKVIEVRK